MPSLPSPPLAPLGVQDIPVNLKVSWEEDLDSGFWILKTLGKEEAGFWILDSHSSGQKLRGAGFWILFPVNKTKTDLDSGCWILESRKLTPEGFENFEKRNPLYPGGFIGTGIPESNSRTNLQTIRIRKRPTCSRPINSRLPSPALFAVRIWGWFCGKLCLKSPC